MSSTIDIPGPLNGSESWSFAYTTIKYRLPVILNTTIDMISLDKKDYEDKPEANSFDDVVARITQLRNELTSNQLLESIKDQSPDADQWNRALEEEKTRNDGKANWTNSAWLFIETYMYRRVFEAIKLSGVQDSYDPFRRQKMEGLIGSIQACGQLADYLLTRITNGNTSFNDEVANLIQISLWGNRCDLSISCGKDAPQTANPMEQVTKLSQNILANDLAKILPTLRVAKTKGDVRIDVILDNAGYELFTDLCLLDYLCTTSQVTTCYLYVKSIPWYVSDTTTSDILWTLKYFAENGSDHLKALEKRWSNYIDSGKWVIKIEDFWTLSYDYSHMQRVDPMLYSDLAKSSLIVLKGDLNYRKLTGDLKWPPNTAFKKALRGFEPAPLVTLRTLKADIVVGLKIGKAEELNILKDDWMISGEYAVIQYND